LKSASFVVDLTDTLLDETTLWWDRPVALIAAQAVLETELAGEAPAHVHVDAAGERLSLLFAAGAAVGSRRVARPERVIVLPARERVKVWGVRHETGGILRVQLSTCRPPTECRQGARRSESGAFSRLGRV